MAKKTKIKIIFGVLISFVGICLLLSTYYNSQKYEVFNEMNEKYLEEIMASIEESDSEEDEINSEEDTTPSETPNENEPEKETVPTTTKKAPVIKTIDYSKYYIGDISIPKIDLKRGFVSKDSKYNNVNRNIYIVPSSDYPDVENGNFILAAHSGTSSISFFKNLYKLENGDLVDITYNNKEYHYKISNIYTDIKDGDVAIKRNKNKNTLTLITCTKGDKETQTIYICELI